MSSQQDTRERGWPREDTARRRPRRRASAQTSPGHLRTVDAQPQGRRDSERGRSGRQQSAPIGGPGRPRIPGPSTGGVSRRPEAGGEQRGRADAASRTAQNLLESSGSTSGEDLTCVLHTVGPRISNAEDARTVRVSDPSLLRLPSCTGLTSRRRPARGPVAFPRPGEGSLSRGLTFP